MPDNFYEVLGTDADASPEDIRKAYKKRALQTHPDRLPPGATTEDKRAADEQFRRGSVNNAYEILMDKKNRKLYDLYGVWPPPEDVPEEPRASRRNRDHRSNHQPTSGPFPGPSLFNDPFFNFPPSPLGAHFSRPHHPAAFRDPYELFNSIFAEMQREMHHAAAGGLMFQPFDPFPPSIFGRSHPFLGSSGPSLFPVFPHLSAFPHDFRGGPPPDRHSRHFPFQSASRGYHDPDSDEDPEWVSETRMVRTINGVTQSIWQRRDRHGNEHVTYTNPDGREEYTLNGVEQPNPRAHIQHAPPRSDLSEHADAQDSLPIIPPDRGNRFSSSDVILFKADVGEGSSKKHWWGRHQ